MKQNLKILQILLENIKKKVKFIGFSENNQGKAGYPKRKKQNQKCEIF